MDDYEKKATRAIFSFEVWTEKRLDSYIIRIYSLVIETYWLENVVYEFKTIFGYFLFFYSFNSQAKILE